MLNYRFLSLFSTSKLIYVPASTSQDFIVIVSLDMHYVFHQLFFQACQCRHFLTSLSWACKIYLLSIQTKKTIRKKAQIPGEMKRNELHSDMCRKYIACSYIVACYYDGRLNKRM